MNTPRCTNPALFRVHSVFYTRSTMFNAEWKGKQVNSSMRQTWGFPIRCSDHIPHYWRSVKCDLSTQNFTHCCGLVLVVSRRWSTCPSGPGSPLISNGTHLQESTRDLHFYLRLSYFFAIPHFMHLASNKIHNQWQNYRCTIHVNEE